MSLLHSITFLFIFFISNAGTETVGAADRSRVRVAFASERDGSGDVFVMSGDGSFPVRLTPCSDAESPDGWIKAVGPSWSPDGEWIAFHVYREERPRALCVMRRDGTERRVIVGDRDATEAAWSPDGAEICFQSNGDLWITPVDGSRPPAQLTELALRERGASWSPDGSRIAFSAYEYVEGRQKEEVYVIDLASGKTTQLTKDGGESGLPRWSPDGKWIAFNAGDDDSADLCLMRPDGTERRWLARTGKLYGAAWSPDATELYATGFFGENTDVYAIALDGSSLRRLSEHPGSENYVAVCPVLRKPNGGDPARVERSLDVEAVVGRNAVDLLRAGDAQFKAQEYAGAAASFRAALARDPEFGRVWLRLGLALHAAGEVEETATAYERAAGYARNMPAAAYNLACLHATQDRLDEAFAALERALATGRVTWAQIERDTDLSSLRADERFAQLKARSR